MEFFPHNQMAFLLANHVGERFTLAYTKHLQWKKDERERLRGEGDQIKVGKGSYSKTNASTFIRPRPSIQVWQSKTFVHKSRRYEEKKVTTSSEAF